jgi:hypothetical protein
VRYAALSLLACLGCQPKPVVEPHDQSVAAVLGPRDASSSDSVSARPTTLVDAGTEPRALLRYAARGSDRSIRLSTIIPDSSMPGPLLTLDLRWVCESDWRRRVEVIEVGGLVSQAATAGPTEREIAKSLDDAFRSTHGSAHATESGLVEINLESNLDLRPDPAFMLGLFAIPLPREAVGPGAVWTAPGELGDVSRYTLVEREHDIIRVDYEEQSNDQQRVHGQFEISLDDPLARSGYCEFVTAQEPVMRGDKLVEREPHRERFELTTL